jgi:hypothetical protein
MFVKELFDRYMLAEQPCLIFQQLSEGVHMYMHEVAC